MAKNKVTEGIVAHIWRHQLLSRGYLRTTNGEVIQVICPGRPNGDKGPDFKEATIATAEGYLVNGDVEIHLGSRGWWVHGHHRNPGYNGVMLHAVLWDEGGRPTISQSSREIPVLALAPHLKVTLEEIIQGFISQHTQPCFGAAERWGARLGELLDKQGEERFCGKAALFKEKLVAEEAEEVLYQGLMQALGYSRNKRTFEELAQRLPLRVLKEFSLGYEEGRRVAILEALLLGMAGLLPPPGQSFIPREAAMAAMEWIWQHFDSGKPLTQGDWHFFRTRPENSPIRRLVGMAHLLNRYLNQGLVLEILDLVTAVSKSVSRLEAGLIVNADNSQGDDFRDNGRAIALIGRGRAREMAVNVVLPFFHAWSEASGHLELAGHIMDIYHAYPRLGENEITRHVREMLGIVSGGGARRQQGLLHLYWTYCSRGKCPHCPLALP